MEKELKNFAYKCERCGNVFDPEVDEDGDEVTPVCPNCKSRNYDVGYYCSNCGEFVSTSDVNDDDEEAICNYCK